MTEPKIGDPLEAIALLDEPTRRRAYDFVVDRHEAVGRDEAAGALGISRELAAFHLDRLAAAGLLDIEYRRLSGRTGPGAGRPAKLYRRSDRELAVSFPPRRYGAAAEVFAEGLDRLNDATATAAVADVARERGADLGAEARRASGARPGRGRLMSTLLDVLRRGGYEPQVDPTDGSVCLRNCPYHELVADHRALTCGMNLAWAEGVVGGLGANVLPVLAPEDGFCCVRFRPRSPVAPSRVPRSG